MGSLTVAIPTSPTDKKKIIHGDDGYVLEDVPHLLDYIPKLSVCSP